MIDLAILAQAPHEWTDTTKYIILLGISLGMNYLHSKNIVHRDLKPANILLDDQYYPRICDFGLSKIIDEQLSRMSTIAGTLLYMAPEIFSRRPYTYKVDVYSFGLIELEIIQSKRSPIEITEIPGKDNQKFFNKCLSPNPSERHDFSEICVFLLSESFMSLFFGLELDEISFYLDNFGSDAEGLLLNGILILSSGKEEAKKSIL